MKKTQITFEVTSDKTEVTAIGLNGSVDKIDITGTEIEKDLTVLLKKLKDYQLEKTILSAMDISTWM